MITAQLKAQLAEYGVPAPYTMTFKRLIKAGVISAPEKTTTGICLWDDQHLADIVGWHRTRHLAGQPQERDRRRREIAQEILEELTAGAT